jgi:hypothetical protein
MVDGRSLAKYMVKITEMSSEKTARDSLRIWASLGGDQVLINGEW